MRRCRLNTGLGRPLLQSCGSGFRPRRLYDWADWPGSVRTNTYPVEYCAVEACLKFLLGLGRRIFRCHFRRQAQSSSSRSKAIFQSGPEGQRLGAADLCRVSSCLGRISPVGCHRQPHGGQSIQRQGYSTTRLGSITFEPKS